MSLHGLITTLIAAILTTVANLLLRKGISSAGSFEPSGAIDAVYRFALLLMEPRFACGFVIYFVAALVWFRVIASEPLSIAYPVMVSLTFVMVTVSAGFFFSERITIQFLAGLIMILGGIALITLESRPARSGDVRGYFEE